MDAFLAGGAALFAVMDAFLAEVYCTICRDGCISCRGALHILHGSAPLGDNFGDNLGITRYPPAIFAGGAALFAGMDAFLAEGYCIICRGALHILHGSAPLGDNFGDNLGITRYPPAIFAGGTALFAWMDAFLA